MEQQVAQHEERLRRSDDALHSLELRLSCEDPVPDDDKENVPPLHATNNISDANWKVFEQASPKKDNDTACSPPSSALEGHSKTLEDIHCLNGTLSGGNAKLREVQHTLQHLSESLAMPIELQKKLEDMIRCEISAAHQEFSAVSERAERHYQKVEGDLRALAEVRSSLRSHDARLDEVVADIRQARTELTEKLLHSRDVLSKYIDGSLDPTKTSVASLSNHVESIQAALDENRQDRNLLSGKINESFGNVKTSMASLSKSIASVETKQNEHQQALAQHRQWIQSISESCTIGMLQTSQS